MKKSILILSCLALFLITSAYAPETVNENSSTVKATHCYKFNIRCKGKAGFYDTVKASTWREATNKMNAKYPDCKATQVKQYDKECP